MPTHRDAFDYVIVGAGSAGCVLANRLSADPGVEVLVLEAGRPDEKREIGIPAAFSELFKTEVDWEFYTTPQPELHDRELYWPRGKVLGGSSSMNAMIYVRGHPSDYDHWASLGNEGWGYDDLLPYFKRAEHNERGGSTVHGTGGPLNVADLREPNELSRAFVEAAAAVGHPRNDDFNDGGQTGVGLYQVTQKGGRRHSAADAYLKPVLDRPNLTARTGAQATRVLFDGDDDGDGDRDADADASRAVGVEYVRDGDTERVRVDGGGEVLVCAGAVNSPHLLMLSGVGPADHLRDHGIPVVRDSPGVGRNLQDHLATSAMYESSRPVSLADADRLLNVAKYLLFKRGPLTSNVAEAGGFVRSEPGLDAPDVQFHFGPAYFVEHGFGNPEGHGFTVGAPLVRPKSRGRVTLASADPLAPPAIDPNYFDHEDDLDVMVEIVRLSREIAQAPPFDDYRGREVLPGPGATSDAAIAEHVRETAETLYHPVGTCRMGDDREAVVDDRLRVRDVGGLRVVDASVMPTIVGGNTNAPTIAIAEKAADLVRDAR